MPGYCHKKYKISHILRGVIANRDLGFSGNIFLDRQRDGASRESMNQNLKRKCGHSSFFQIFVCIFEKCLHHTGTQVVFLVLHKSQLPMGSQQRHFCPSSPLLYSSVLISLIKPPNQRTKEMQIWPRHPVKIFVILQEWRWCLLASVTPMSCQRSRCHGNQ